MKQKIILNLSYLLLCGFFIIILSDIFTAKGIAKGALQHNNFLGNNRKQTSQSIAKFQTTAPTTHTFYLIAGGDIMLSRNIGYYNKKSGYDRIFGSGTFNPISQFPTCTTKNCLLFFNLESLFHPKDNDIQMGGFTFRANEKSIETLLQLQTLGTGKIPLLLSIANNHTANGGFAGMEKTQHLLEQHHIGSIGAGTSPQEATKLAIYPTDGGKLCFQSYSYEGKENLKIGGEHITRNAIDESTILNDLKEMKKLNCDVKILSLHRGAEYRLHPNQRQKNLAHTLIDNGADLILGGHSHVPGEIEKYKGKYIFYSFGNFIFDQGRGKKTREKGFDYIYDYTLKRKTVPTYIAMLAGLRMVKFPNGTKILLDKITMSTTTNGIHELLDTQTQSGIVAEITS